MAAAASEWGRYFRLRAIKKNYSSFLWGENCIKKINTRFLRNRVGRERPVREFRHNLLKDNNFFLCWRAALPLA